MERATYTSKSFLISLALVKRQIDVDQAAQAAHVEMNSQIERWGEVEDSKFHATVVVATLLTNLLPRPRRRLP